MPPVNFLIKPASSLCNMRCRYCFYADVSQHRAVPSYGVMTLDTAEVLVRKALDYAEHQCTFAFQGGEPTMAGLPFFEGFVALVEKYNTRRVPVHYALQTNGLVIDDEWAAFLGKHKFLVGISMDGDAATHNDLRPDSQGKGTFTRVQRATERLRRHKVDYNILCVVTRDIARHGARTYGALKRHQYLQFIPCIDDLDGSLREFALTPELLARFLKAMFDLYYHDFMAGQYVSVRAFDNYIHLLLGQPAENCAMSGRCTCNPVVEGDGSVYPCDFYVLDRWRLGDLHTDDLAGMLTGARAQEFVVESYQDAPECAACRWFPLCRGGCRRDRDWPDTDALGSNRFCEAYREFFEYSYERMREIARAVSAPRRQGR